MNQNQQNVLTHNCFIQSNTELLWVYGCSTVVPQLHIATGFPFTSWDFTTPSSSTVTVSLPFSTILKVEELTYFSLDMDIYASE